MVRSDAVTGSLRVGFLVTAWLALVVSAVVFGITHGQAELQDDAETALAAAGVDVDDLSFDGRDAVVVVAEERRAEVAAVLGGVDGIRSVRFAGTAAVTPEPTPTSGTSTPAPSAAGPVATSSTVPTGTPYLVASLRAGAVVIEGAIPDAEAAARLDAIAQLVYAPYLENRLEVDPSLDAASWVAQAPVIVARLPIVGTSSIDVRGEEATLSGLAPTEIRLAQAAGAMQQALGPGVAFTNDMIVTGFTPPFVHVEAPGDGTVTLTGVMPNQEVLDLIAGTAIEVFGAEAVTNDLVLGTRVDSTFSLYRLPLTFVAFSAVPQWEVTIDDDLITGALRGGATFASGSSQLSPQLLELMPVAAGILIRNPTLGMVIEGHTDNIGGDDSNLRLSIARAEAARAWLIEAGVEPEGVVAVGYGEERPIGDNSTSDGRAVNRRVEFLLGPVDAQGGQ
ncbi:MAG TPA: OmpA family protein [Acidimicrobiia bacterium]|jgi:outer membrane protein OmpA-like peptidoglycan-associated protein